MKYITNPQLQTTLGSTVVGDLKSANIELNSCEVWKADLTFKNEDSIYPNVATKGTAVQVEVKDASEAAYTTLFKGTVLFPQYTSGEKYVTFTCMGVGNALNMMNCAEEYGTQSKYPALDSLKEIISDASYGIVPKHVNKYRGTAYDSGYSIDVSKVDDGSAINEVIPFINFPWKPADKCLNDLCDLDTALNASNIGPAWICDHDGYLRLKQIGTSQTGWTKYYGNSQANATLNEDEYRDGDFQPVGKEANVMLQYGVWRRPSNGDYCEGNHADFGTDGGTITFSDDATNHLVNVYGVRCTNSALGGVGFQYPATQDAAWDFSGFTPYNTPSVNFNLLLSRLMNTNGGALAFHYIKLYTAGAGGGNFAAYPGETIINETGQFKHYSYPIGPYSGQNNFQWEVTGTPDWAQIDYVDIYCPMNDAGYATLDGLNFGGSALLRVARQEFPDEIAAGRGTLGTTANPVKMRVLTPDRIGKDDSLTASDDSFLYAQLAKAELLRSLKEVENAKFNTTLIPDIWPEQYLYFKSKDWRITKLTHRIQMPSGFRTYFEVTDDLTNSHPRLRFEDVNKRYAAMRPEYQDRQSTAIKSGDLDIRVLPLEKAYNI